VDWYAEAEFTAHATDDAVEQIAPAFVATYYNSADRVLRVRQRLDAGDYGAALDQAQRWVRGDVVPAVHGVDPDARVVRVAVESAEAVMRLVGTADFAKLLGVSTNRVRQLAEMPGFPAAEDTSAGAVWPRDVAETYAARRPPRGKGGRPRKDDGGP
jgi:hypothetical protein